MLLRRPRILRRARLWLLVGGAVLMGVLYYRPVHSYLHTKDSLARRTGEVRQLSAEKHALEQRLALAASGATLVRRARRLGLVKPGERLFIVKGIAAWRRARQAVHSAH
ncbi:MAG TPA: septum formation initiator family protein [Candidatus Eisenbacteria bacterium]|nr:septum formation initiator family protein [Candidatus Eisenbacteria bacterium]